LSIDAAALPHVIRNALNIGAAALLQIF
jgi:hypothetical protein